MTHSVQPHARLSLIYASSLEYEVPNLKVEKILKGSLDWILSPSPSVKIQTMGRKVCLKRKGKTLLGFNKLLNVDITRQCFVLLPKRKLSRQ